MLMNYDNTIMEILQKITISAVVVLMNCDKLTIKGKITGIKHKLHFLLMFEYDLARFTFRFSFFFHFHFSLFAI